VSAYVCDDVHFRALGLFAAGHTGGYGRGHQRVNPCYIQGLKQEGGVGLLDGLDSHVTAVAYANILKRENVRSVNARYREDQEFQAVSIPANETDRTYNLGPVAILKMCDGLEYQSCETEDYERSVGYELLRWIRKAAIRELPGYEDGPWTLDKTKEVAA